MADVDVATIDKLLREIERWKWKAEMFSRFDPLGFLVVQGCSLPEYLKQLNELSALWKQIKEKSAR